MAAMGAVDIGQCLPALHTDPELMERQRLGVVDQRRDGVDDVDPDPGWPCGELADLSHTEAAGVQLVVHQRRVAAQRDGAYPVTHLDVGPAHGCSPRPRTQACPSALHDPRRLASSNTATISASIRRRSRSSATSRSAKPWPSNSLSSTSERMYASSQRRVTTGPPRRERGRAHLHARWAASALRGTRSPGGSAGRSADSRGSLSPDARHPVD